MRLFNRAITEYHPNGKLKLISDRSYNTQPNDIYKLYNDNE